MTAETTDRSTAELFQLAGLAVDQLQGAGLTDGQITLRLARSLRDKGHDLDFLPTSGHGAAIDVLFSQLPPDERGEMADIIAARSGHIIAWPKWIADAIERAENDDRIGDLRMNLNAALNDALAALAAAVRAHAQLVDAYDVEHAEGGDLFPYYLGKAERSLKTAAAVNPTRTEGK